ncbi:MAG TPA: amidohydrolase [Pseudolysinimonas sp.]|nr:amidohydrolase [Pseudolysinimonas sp.]
MKKVMPPPVAIVGGSVLPAADAELLRGTVLVRDGRIQAVGSDVPVPPDAELIDAAGMWVVPGFVEPHAHAGVHEESSGEAGEDTNETSAPDMAGIRALDGINVEDPAFSQALLGGVTTTVIKPGSSNPFGGQAVAIKTAGGPTVDSRVLRDAVAVKSAFGENPKAAHGIQGRTPVTRMGTAYAVRQALVNARRAASTDEDQPDLHMAALARLLAGELAWDVHVHRHDDIATAMRIAEEFELRLVINHGTESYKLLDEIAARGIPVVLGPLFSARSKVELAGARWSTAALLHDAGIEVALTTDHPEVPLHLLVQEAAFAMREGLPREVALRSITSAPASIYGLGDRVGSLTAGADADIVLWSADPFDAQSHVEKVLVDGALVYDRSAAQA